MLTFGQNKSIFFTIADFLIFLVKTLFTNDTIRFVTKTAHITIINLHMFYIIFLENCIEMWKKNVKTMKNEIEKRNRCFNNFIIIIDYPPEYYKYEGNDINLT